MKSFRWLVLLAFLLAACQSNAPRTVIILDGETVVTLTTAERAPMRILAEAGIALQPTDRVLVNGVPHAVDEEITVPGAIQLQVRRAVTVTLVTPQGGQTIQSSALRVGEVLDEAGVEIGAGDSVNPAVDAPINEGMTIAYTPARDLVVTSGGTSMTIRSSAKTVGEALAEAGIPLMGLDASHPSENEALPADGQIRVVRVRESISVEIQSIPFETETTYSEDVAFGKTEILQPGLNGLAMIRTRIRYEDGVETSREVEDEVVLQEPRKQIAASGSKIVLGAGERRRAIQVLVRDADVCLVVLALQFRHGRMLVRHGKRRARRLRHCGGGLPVLSIPRRDEGLHPRLRRCDHRRHRRRTDRRDDVRRAALPMD
ncbi:MAG: DUF348 domain-containing protein [Chloroflexi bacterium]|nr:DUF348 domain-containing protein [Chloroflexota bacterium]